MNTKDQSLSITGEVRPGAEFQFEKKPSNMAQATFVALVDGRMLVTRRVFVLFALPDETPVVAHWHGQYRTDAFATTVKLLKAKAKEWRDH